MTRTPRQEALWEGSFGNDYTSRNTGADWIGSNTAFFSTLLANTGKLQRILELGSNSGLNLMALAHLCPGAKRSAGEISQKAVSELKVPGVELHAGSILDCEPVQTWDLVFTKGGTCPYQSGRIAQGL